MAGESNETVNLELADRIDPSDPATLVFDPSDYLTYSPDSAVVTLAWIKGQLGIVMWNLEPGQWNDYHLHPTTEHLHIVLCGEVEYLLGELPPVRLTAGKAVIVPAGVPHAIHNVGVERASYVAVTSPGPYEKVLVDKPTTAVS